MYSSFCIFIFKRTFDHLFHSKSIVDWIKIILAKIWSNGEVVYCFQLISYIKLTVFLVWHWNTVAIIYTITTIGRWQMEMTKDDEAVIFTAKLENKLLFAQERQRKSAIKRERERDKLLYCNKQWANIVELHGHMHVRTPLHYCHCCHWWQVDIVQYSTLDLKRLKYSSINAIYVAYGCRDILCCLQI